MTREVGTIVLKSDSRGINKGTDSLRKMNRQAGRTEKGTDRLAKSFKRMGRMVGLAAGVMAGLFLRSVLRNTIEQEQAVAQLNASLRSTGRFTEEASRALRDHAAALQQVSTFGDEAIIVLQSQLLTFKQLGGDILPRATESALDLSVKMGGDLKAAAKQLGLALNDPIRGLSRLSLQGVSFSEAQKKVILHLVKTNQLAKAQALILDELDSEFGKSAFAARNTLGGALSVLKNNFGDLLEGDSGGGGVIGVTAALNELADTLAKPEVKEGFQRLTTGALGFLEVAARLPGVLQFMNDEFLQFQGIVRDEDLIRRSEQLRKLKDELADLNAQGPIRAHFVFGNREFIISQLEEEIAREEDALKRIRQSLAETLSFGGDAAGRVASTVAAVEGDPEGLTPDEIKAQNKLKLDAARATDALRDSLRELAEQQGGPSVQAAHQLEDALEAVAAQEKALLALGPLTLQQEQDLADAREGAMIQHQQTIDLLKAEADQAEETGDAMSEFAIQAARNIQTTFADFLFDPFDDGLLGMVKGFANAMRRMVAEAAALNILEALFGKGGGLGGILSGIFSKGATGGGSPIGGARAHGGPVAAGIPYPVGEFGPELFIPSSAGTVVPNNQLGGNSVVVNIDARQTDNPAALLALVPLITTQVEQGLFLKMRRGIA